MRIAREADAKRKRLEDAAVDDGILALLLAFRDWIDTLKGMGTVGGWGATPTALADLFVAQLPLDQAQLASHILASDTTKRLLDASGIFDPDAVAARAEKALRLEVAAIRKAVPGINIRIDDFKLPAPVSPLVVDITGVPPVSGAPPVGSAGAAEAWPAEYQKAAEWMQKRGVMTVDEINALARSIVPVTDPQFGAVLRDLRSKNIALAGSERAIITDRIRNAITGAIEQGLTFSDFVSTLDEWAKDGQLPPWARGYADTVFRTETANAYGAQRDWLDAQPGVIDHTWGYEFFNPADDRSNVSHAAMNGVAVQLGSAADFAARPGPPWFYNCRCDRLPILVADPETETSYSETPDAMARVTNILRF